MLEERRQFPRLVPSTPLFVSMDEAKGGLLLDLCEGGLAVASLVPRNLDDVVSVTFDLPEGVGHIEAKARVAWTRDSGHLTGVRFMDLDEVSHQQLSEWIAAGTNLRPAGSDDLDEPVIVTRSTYAQVDAIRREVRPETRTAMWPEMQVDAEPQVGRCLRLRPRGRRRLRRKFRWRRSRNWSGLRRRRRLRRRWRRAGCCFLSRRWTRTSR